MSTSEKVTRQLQRMRRGVPFSISQFHELGSAASVQKALSRLAHEGLIERVAKGIYVRPKSLASMPSIKISASAEQIAKNGHSRTATHWLDKASNPRIDLAFRHRHPSKPFLE